MAIEVDRTRATKLLEESLARCMSAPVGECAIRDTIDLVMGGKNCLTYRYILLTALLAKAADKHADILSLQASDTSKGAYDARSLASKVVYPFQLAFLGNVLDGSNSDPLVNKPARFSRLSLGNHVAGGDPKKALTALCRDLPAVKTQAMALACLDYTISLLLNMKREMDAKAAKFETATRDMGAIEAREFISELLDQGFGGAALTVAATALFSLQFKSGDGYCIVPHPVNQSGASKRQFSDLDVLKNGRPFLGVELKDRPFSEIDVRRAADMALSAGAASLIFVAGRMSSFASQPPTYFAKARAEYGMRGLCIGLTSIDSLLDTLLAFHAGFDAAALFATARETVERIGAVEAQMWIYKNLLSNGRPQ